MPNLNEILQKLWGVLPGLLGLFIFLATLGIFVAITAWENAARRDEILRMEKERKRDPPPPPPAPEPAVAGRERARTER